jgi:uroporphyrinogen decarboxylase
MYTNWSGKLLKNLCELGFDFVWAFDDIAYTTGLMFSPDVFRGYFKQPMKKAASSISVPWIFHSDGDYSAVLDDIIDIGASAIHPIERESMDYLWLKENYGKKLCLVGNIDINYTLSKGSVKEVEEEVKARISELGPGGGYIICDSNSVPDFCKAENITAMSQAVHKYRNIY